MRLTAQVSSRGNLELIRGALVFVVFILSACSEHRAASYDVLPNTIKAGGARIIYDPASTFTNITQITSELEEKERAVFNESLAWYGTEADFGLDQVHLKTARQLVNIVNCLKVTEQGNQPLCFR